MAYEVIIAPAALADAKSYVEFIRADRGQPLGAHSWWNGLLESIESLENSPQRCALIPEQTHFAEEVRHLIYFSHRII